VCASFCHERAPSSCKLSRVVSTRHWPFLCLLFPVIHSAIRISQSPPFGHQIYNLPPRAMGTPPCLPVGTLALTLEGRPLDLLTITDHHGWAPRPDPVPTPRRYEVPVHPPPSRPKYTIFSNRWHPGGGANSVVARLVLKN